MHRASRAGSIELRRETVDLASVVANAVQTARPLIDDAGHQLAVALPPTPVILNADPVRLTQVLGNLLTNAAKYTPHGGQIWLTGRRKSGGALLSVRDTGLGIPAEMLPQIFDMFAQVESSLSRARGGMGLGLALARNLSNCTAGGSKPRALALGKAASFWCGCPPPRRRTIAHARRSPDVAKDFDRRPPEKYSSLTI